MSEIISQPGLVVSSALSFVPPDLGGRRGVLKIAGVKWKGERNFFVLFFSFCNIKANDGVDHHVLLELSGGLQTVPPSLERENNSFPVKITKTKQLPCSKAQHF